VDLNPVKKKSTRSWVRNMRNYFPTLFLSWYKKMSTSFFIPALAQFLQGPMDSAKVPAELPEDSRVVRARDLVL